MASIKKNTVSNFIGQAWPAVMGFILVPIYITHLGIEAYGLLGFLLSLQATVSLLELGMGATANREMAGHYRENQYSQELWEIYYTLLTIYLAVTLIIGIGLWMLSKPIADYWLTSIKLSKEQLNQYLNIFVLTMAIRWPITLFLGLLRGMQEQIIINKIGIILGTARMMCTVIALVALNGSLEVVLLIQLFSGLVELIALWKITQKKIPGNYPKRWSFRKEILKRILKFSTGVGVISILAAGLKQTDKIIISKILSLEQFGYYVLASKAASVILFFVSPIVTAVYPRLTAHFRFNQHDELRSIYLKASFAVTCFSAPVAAILIFYGSTILEIWTGSVNVANETSMTLKILGLATILNAPMQVSYALQLASGNLKIPLLFNSLSLVGFVPLVYVSVTLYGIDGGAFAWMVFNFCYYLIVPHFTHRIVLKDAKMRWYVNETGLNMIIALLVYGAIDYILMGNNTYLPILEIILATITYVFITVARGGGNMLLLLEKFTRKH